MNFRHLDSRAVQGKVTLEWSLKQRLAKELPKPIHTHCAEPGGTTALWCRHRTPQINSLTLKHPLHTQPFYIKQNSRRLYFIIFLSALFMFPNNLLWPGLYLCNSV